MKTMTYTESRARYAEVLDQAVNDREEIVITRQGHESVVIIALDEYESLMETVYLMQSPANARHLLSLIHIYTETIRREREFMPLPYSMSRPAVEVRVPSTPKSEGLTCLLSAAFELPQSLGLSSWSAAEWIEHKAGR